MHPQPNAFLPHPAEILERVQESDYVFTLRLRFTEPAMRDRYSFQPGQFNMVYLYGAGEVPISIVSDPQDEIFDHTIRAVGRVTDAMARLKPGQIVGVRGPYGRGWPLADAQGKDVIVVTGGLGCAPAVSAINYVIRRRAQFRRLYVIQGVKKSKELIWRARYEAWGKVPDTRVLLAADSGDALWPGHVGVVTDLFDKVDFHPAHALAMMCGPEGMMVAGARALAQRGMQESQIFLSMERNMHCGFGLCGHCQFGGKFICRDGPVFAYSEVKELLGTRGF